MSGWLVITLAFRFWLVAEPQRHRYNRFAFHPTVGIIKILVGPRSKDIVMARGVRHIGAPESPVRRLILQRIKELDTTMRTVSRDLGKNDTYIQQFVYRGTPIELAKTTRNRLAAMLHVRPDLLDVTKEGEPQIQLALPSPQASQSNPTSRPPLGASVTTQIAGQLPQFSEVDDIEPPGGGTDWPVCTTAQYAAGASFALWLSQPRGRNRMERLLVRAGRPPLIGDMVVIVRRKRVVAIGELSRLDKDHAHVSVADSTGTSEAQPFIRKDVQLLKVTAADFA